MSYSLPFQPFMDTELSEVLESRMNDLKRRVEQFTDDEVLANDENYLADNLYEEFRIAPIELMDEDPSKRKMVQKKINIANHFRSFHDDPRYFEADGVVIDICMPYTGDSFLLKCKASTYFMSGFPQIATDNQYILLHFECQIIAGNIEKTAQEFESQHARDIYTLRRGIDYVNDDVAVFNLSIRNKALEMIRNRKQVVTAFHKLSEILTIPIQQTDFAQSHIAEIIKYLLTGLAGNFAHF